MSKILIISDGLTLSHILRPLEIARNLVDSGFEVHFAYTYLPDYARVQMNGIVLHQLPIHISQQAFMNAIDNGQHPFTEKILRSQIEEDMALIDRIQPDLVCGDMRLSLHVSSQLKEVKYLNITNITWDQNSVQKTSIPSLPVTRAMGLPLSKMMLSLMKNFIYHRLAKVFNKVAKSYDVAPYGNYLDVLTSGEYVAFCDIKSLVPNSKLTKKRKTIGGLTYTLKGERQSFFKTYLPKIVVMLGSSGPQHLLFKMIRHLDLEKYEVLVVGGAKLPFQHVNLHQTPSVDLESQVKNVDLVVTNGGSGSGYICLKNGIPFIAIASNLDQFQYSQAMTDKGVAQTLRADHFDGMEFMRVVAKMLHTSIYAVEASKIAKEILKDDPKRNILNFVSEILGVSQAEKETSESIVNSSNNMSFTDMIE